ncbi:MAG TPA: hypothetical protein VKV21_17360 [Solirubrobacteraceae bacterium]|nr:hypothetical protein [Solirubrobacteraceae bacterium]
MARSSRRKRATRRRRPGGHPATASRSAAERELEALLEQMRARAIEAQASETPVERVAEIVVEDFEEMPSPVGFVQVLTERGSPERARAVVTAVSQLAPGTVTALTLAAEAARELDGDRGRAEELLDAALVLPNTDCDPQLAEHLLAAGQAIAALECLQEAFGDDPADEQLLEIQAAALEEVHRAARARARPRRDEREALEHFADRTLLYRLRSALRERVDTDPALRERAARSVRRWLRDAGISDDEAPLAPVREAEREALVRAAIESSWLSAPGGEIDDGDEDVDEDLIPTFSESGTPLAAVALDPDVHLDVSEAAFDWWDTCTYGLWLVEDPEPRPGVWLTEIVSGARRYVAIPDEQLEGLRRWSVVLGPLVALEGAWRTGGTFIALRPSEGDAAAAVVKDAVADMIRSLEGKRPRGRRRRAVRAEPHGVLVGSAGPADPSYVDLAGAVCRYLMPTLVGELRARRATRPAMRTMDGEEVKLITATVALRGGIDPHEALRDHPDVRAEDDGELTWWGRALSDTEREAMLAELRAQLGDDADVEPEEPPRWLRGRMRPIGGGLQVEVNSRERLAALLALLDEVGLQPEATRESVIDPAQDLPAFGGAGPFPFGSTVAQVAAWRERLLSTPSPALGGASPRRAARRAADRPLLEALLRDLEHDADILAERDEPIPDFAEIRAELGLARGAT